MTTSQRSEDIVPGSGPVDHEETIFTDVQIVGCDGGGGALGHPVVYLNVEDGEIICPYCSRRFVLVPGTGQASGH